MGLPGSEFCKSTGHMSPNKLSGKDHTIRDLIGIPGPTGNLPRAVPQDAYDLLYFT